MRRRRVVVAAVAAAVSVLINACDTNDGREMQAPDSIARFRLENTTTSTSTTVAPPPTEFIAATSSTSSSSLSPSSTSSTSSTVAPTSTGVVVAPAESAAATAAGAGAELQFAGPWEDAATIPVEFTCDGEEAVPLITWAAPPDGTAELAVSVVDRDADGFVHWLVVGLPPEAGSVGGGEPLVTGATDGVNSFGDPGWAGPCPPPGDGPHTYQFTLHVLDQATELPAESPTGDLLAAVDAATASSATFTGTYERA